MQSTDKIKVLYVINHSTPYGSNKALLNLLKDIKLKGIVPLVVTAYDGGICNDLKVNKIEYHILRHYFSIYPELKNFRDYILYIPQLLRMCIYNKKAQRQLIEITEKFKPDIIHTNIGPDHIGVNVAKYMNIPHVWHIREYQDLYFGWHAFPSKKSFNNKLNSKNNHTIAITNALKQHYHLNINSKVICDGVMFKSDKQFVANKEKYFLFVGRIEESKGIRQLISAYIEFCSLNSEYSLLIAGDGNVLYVKKLQILVDQANLSKRILFLGFRADIYNLMAKATALIVNSYFEVFGLITAEAMFNGCLVIGRNIAGTKEILETEDLGVLFSGQKELVLVMENIISNGIETYFKTILKAQEKAIDYYSIEQNSLAIYNYYKEILRRKL